MHWDKDSWTVISTASTVVLAVWAAIQGGLKIQSEQREAREKIARELVEKDRAQAEKDDPAVMRERRVVERGTVDLKSSWEQTDYWKGQAQTAQGILEGRDARWETLGLTEAEGVRIVRKWQESLGRNAVKEYDAGGIDTHGKTKGQDNV